MIKSLLKKIDYLRAGYNRMRASGKKLYNVKLMAPSYLDRHKGRDFLVLASGNSLKKEEVLVHKFIRKYQPIVITANNMVWFTIPDYHSFFNRSRFCMFANTIRRKSKVILSPYLSKRLIKKHYRGDYEHAMFQNIDNRTFEIDDGIISSNCRSSALLNVGISSIMGARNIYVAGLDGFIDVYKSYKEYVVDEPRTCTYEQMRDIQGEYIEIMQEFLKKNNKSPFKIITTTHFKDHYKPVKECLL